MRSSSTTPPAKKTQAGATTNAPLLAAPHKATSGRKAHDPKQARTHSRSAPGSASGPPDTTPDTTPRTRSYGVRALTTPGNEAPWDDARRGAMLRRFGEWFSGMTSIRRKGRRFNTRDLMRRSQVATGGKPLIDDTTLRRYRTLAAWNPASGVVPERRGIDLIVLLWLCLDPFEVNPFEVITYLLGGWRDILAARGTLDAETARMEAERLADTYTRLAPARRVALADYARFLALQSDQDDWEERGAGRGEGMAAETDAGIGHLSTRELDHLGQSEDAASREVRAVADIEWGRAFDALRTQAREHDAHDDDGDSDAPMRDATAQVP